MINDNTLTKLYTKMNLNSNRNPKLMTTTAAHIPTMVILTLYKGQLISKRLFGILEFLQKTNKQIRF